MIIDLSKSPISSIGERVRAIMGVPELILLDDVISSPVFTTKAEKYINSNIKEYENLDKNLIEIATLYYISYLLCPGMYSRLPKQMENVSTKTMLQNINWDKMAVEMLQKCRETLDEAIFLETNEPENYFTSFATLTPPSPYPNSNL